jgi:hypothetical protein
MCVRAKLCVLERSMYDVFRRLMTSVVFSFPYVSTGARISEEEFCYNEQKTCLFFHSYY